MILTGGFAVDAPGLPVTLASALAVAALVYCRGWFRLRRFVPEVMSPWRPSAFFGGLVALWVAVGSPLAALDEELLSVHMVQHLLLSAGAAPLILLGAPALPLLRGLPAGFVSHGLAPLLRWSPVRGLARVLGQPAVCWSVAMVVFIGWHSPAMFELGLRSEPWHAVEHASFFVSGLLFWWPVVQPWPSTGPGRGGWFRCTCFLPRFRATHCPPSSRFPTVSSIRCIFRRRAPLACPLSTTRHGPAP